MPVKSYTITCTSNRLIARDIYEVSFEKPLGFTFKPGQFVLFDIALLDDAADIQPRAFSLASAPEEESLLFIFKLKEGGRASAWVQQLKEGDTATIKGPFGFFTLRDEPKDIAFLCTSTGIAPFRSMLVSAKQAGDKRKIDLLFGVRSEEDLFWYEELQQLSQGIENFTSHVTLSQPPESWPGHKGRIQHVIPLVLPDLSRRKVYVCGNPDMTNDIKKLCLEEWGMQKEDLHVEGYI